MAITSKEMKLDMRDRDHHEGCPGGDRTESYVAIRPANPSQGEGKKRILVARCIDCGGHRIKEVANGYSS